MRATVCARRASQLPWILVMVMDEGATLRAFMSAAVRLNFGCLKTASTSDPDPLMRCTCSAIAPGIAAQLRTS
jgi:hypothetical protein